MAARANGKTMGNRQCDRVLGLAIGGEIFAMRGACQARRPTMADRVRRKPVAARCVGPTSSMKAMGPAVIRSTT